MACIAALFEFMSFSYNLGANPPIDYVRLLISDTQSTGHIFEDEEIASFTAIQALQFQSAQFYDFPAGRNLPNTPVSYLRVAALALDTLASNKARLASITEVLDVKLSPATAASALRDQAAAYRQTDDDAGAFAIIEQCPTQWAFIDRFWKTVQRGSAS